MSRKDQPMVGQFVWYTRQTNDLARSSPSWR